MSIALTDRYLRSLEPPETGRVEISDAKRKGLRYRLSASGQGVWMYEKRIKGGPKRKHTLGNWPAVSLANARQTALVLEGEAAQGIDRVENARIQREKDEAAKAGLVTVANALDSYEELYLRPNLRTASERVRQLQSALSDHLQKPIGNLTRSDLQSAVDAKAQSGAPFAANRVRAALSAFTRWAWRRGYVENDISAGVSKAVNEAPRERIMSVAEVQEVMRAAGELGPLWAPFIRLMILTAQRRGDIAKLQWSEVEFSERRLSLKGARTKNKAAHITHLSEPSLEQIDLAREYQSDQAVQSAFVFSTTGRSPISGFGKTKAKLDKLINEARSEAGIEPMEPWRFHDLRTAFATAMAEAGEPENVVDRILNHVASGSAPSAVARVYNRAEQLPQRARVLERWTHDVSAAAIKANSLVRLKIVQS